MRSTVLHSVLPCPFAPLILYELDSSNILIVNPSVFTCGEPAAAAAPKRRRSRARLRVPHAPRRAPIGAAAGRCRPGRLRARNWGGTAAAGVGRGRARGVQHDAGRPDNALSLPFSPTLPLSHSPSLYLSLLPPPPSQGCNTTRDAIDKARNEEQSIDRSRPAPTPPQRPPVRLSIFMRLPPPSCLERKRSRHTWTGAGGGGGGLGEDESWWVGVGEGGGGAKWREGEGEGDGGSEGGREI